MSQTISKSLMGGEDVSVLTVHTARPYDILVGTGLLDRAGEFSRQVNGGSRALIVTDSHVGPLYARRVARSLEAAGYRTGEFPFPAGKGASGWPRWRIFTRPLPPAGLLGRI